MFVADLHRITEDKENEVDSLKKEKELLQSKMMETEQSLTIALQQEKSQRQEDVETLNREKDEMRIKFEGVKDEILRSAQQEKEETLARYDKEVQELKDEISSSKREHQDQIHMLETDKAQVFWSKT